MASVEIRKAIEGGHKVTLFLSRAEWGELLAQTSATGGSGQLILDRAHGDLRLMLGAESDEWVTEIRVHVAPEGSAT